MLKRKTRARTRDRRKIRYVDGFAIRNLYPDLDIIETYSTCGDWSCDPPTPFVPADEIWIDRRFRKETRFLLKVHRAALSRRSWTEKRVRDWLKETFTRKGVPPPFVARSEKRGRLTVRYVRGEIVRRYIDPWFIFGGHDLVYDYVPAGEVWIDLRQDPREVPYTLFHELHERRLMAKGMSYPKAHKQTSEVERRKRRRELIPPRPRPLKLKPFSQRTAYCGPASMKIVCAYFGREYEEKALGDLCGTTLQDGTDHAGLIKGAEAIGATVFSKAGGTVGDLRRFTMKHRLPVIVGWYSPSDPRKTKFVPGKDEMEDHFSVVYHVSRDYVYMMDPEVEGAGKRRMRIGRFLKLWWDTDTPKVISVRRWFMVMRFDGKPF
ncbi:MAG: hypothetical protein RL272_490 [Candidatus Parcubacteria bacterium]|jgi:predicted double-glycine peptidase